MSRLTLNWSAFLMGLFAAMSHHVAAHSGSTLSTVGSIAAIVGSSVAVLLLLASVGRWWFRRRWSLRVVYTDASLKPEIAGKTATVPVQPDHDVYVKIVSRGEVEFNEIQVRPQETTWHLKRVGSRVWRHFDSPPRETIRLVSIKDVYLDYGGDRSELPWKFSQFPVDDDRGLIVGLFLPGLRRVREEVVALCVKVHADREWSG